MLKPISEIAARIMERARMSPAGRRKAPATLTRVTVYGRTRYYPNRSKK